MHKQTNVLPALAAEMRSAPMLGEQDERELARAAANGSQQAFDALVTSHLRLVGSIAREFGSYGLPMEDLVSEGSLGLVEAARRFDPEKGVRLAAYAAWWIRSYLRRYTIGHRRIVRAPSTRNGRRLMANLRKVQRGLSQRTGGPAPVELVARALDVSTTEVEEMDAALSARDVPVGPVHDRGEVEPADAAPSPERRVADAEERSCHLRAIDTALDSLSPRERRILKLRYLNGASNSLARIGDDLGLSRERVRQLERDAQAKIRDTLLPSVA
jgi:RNA polymerase sigma-32 factor